jgi:hypothetical protein
MVAAALHGGARQHACSSCENGIWSTTSSAKGTGEDVLLTEGLVRAELQRRVTGGVLRAAGRREAR